MGPEGEGPPGHISPWEPLSEGWAAVCRDPAPQASREQLSFLWATDSSAPPTTQGTMAWLAGLAAPMITFSRFPPSFCSACQQPAIPAHGPHTSSVGRND